MTGYVSPYGRARGLAGRLRATAAGMGTNRALWRGLGIIEDLHLVASILNRREWLEKLRLSDDPEAQQFAAELLDEVDTLEAAENAAAYVKGLPDEPAALDPVLTIERLDERAQDYEKVRSLLVELGALSAADRETPVGDLVRALLS